MNDDYIALGGLQSVQEALLAIICRSLNAQNYRSGYFRSAALVLFYDVYDGTV